MSIDTEHDARERLSRHFGSVDWTRQKLGTLDVVATSPTESVRAALVQAALSELAHDIASAAGASPQEVNVLALTQQLAADLAEGPFDGNDHNNAVDFHQGLQLGVCGPVASCSAPREGCAVGACRPLCDLYAGTPRALLAGEMIKVIGSDQNRTRLDTADVLAVARAMAGNVDGELFDACVEDLDRLPPKLAWIGGGLEGGLSYGLRNWLDASVELGAVGFTHATYEPATVAISNNQFMGRVERATRIAQFRVGATVRLGVAWVPVLYLGVGLGARDRTAATLVQDGRHPLAVTPDGMAAGLSLDVVTAARVGLEHRIGPRRTVGVDASASHALGIGTSSFEMVSVNLSLAYSWYPSWPS